MTAGRRRAEGKPSFDLLLALRCAIAISDIGHARDAHIHFSLCHVIECIRVCISLMRVVNARCAYAYTPSPSATSAAAICISCIRWPVT